MSKNYNEVGPSGRHRVALGTGGNPEGLVRGECGAVRVSSLKNQWAYLRANTDTLNMKSGKELRRLLLLALDRIHELEKA